ncbi:hypothetical protein O9G_000243 [Rozella allomycis CSF55]|uniref:Syntaxin 6 N-terminal domain-containing protein n=1 Tax=Rozella allomycis (strain CSF55) TaxID=988480 RepID=A0A075AP68_ROZAC|nr:hypothetical protein O9G_000243 [Rozella allomycis CSF55]|eukprot:EPZ31764.1 hypothetical protein O9G_000243 [Rozella allomycis CSF55]
MNEDPFYLVFEDISLSLNRIEKLLQQDRSLWKLDEIKNQLKTVELDINELSDTINILFVWKISLI